MRRHLTYANVISTLCLVLIVGGGAAYAANTVFSSDIVDNQVRSVDVRDDTLSGGGLTAADLRSASVGNTEIADGGVRSPEVQNEALTGADILDQSGVDTCVQTIRIGQLCVRAENFARPWSQALAHCANLDLRLPSLAEAMELAQTHDIPNVDDSENFWTGDHYLSGANDVADFMDDAGNRGLALASNQLETVCVTTPTN